MRPILVFVAAVLTPLAGAAVVEIPNMSGTIGVDYVWIDMDNVGPAGPTTVNAINQGAIPTSGVAGNIVNISLTYNPATSTGTYNFQPDRGRGLSGGPPPTGTELYLIDPPAGQFTPIDTEMVELGMVSTEFGWSIGDWSGPCNAFLFLGGNPVGSIQVSFSGSPAPHFIQSTEPFDRVDISMYPDYPSANWVNPDLYVQIPEPASLSLLGLGALALLRRR